MKAKEADKFVTGLAEEVHNRLVGLNVKAKAVTIKLKVRKEGAPKETAKFLGSIHQSASFVFVCIND